MLVVLVFGMIDFGRAIMVRQILANISREAANLASRGTTLTNALTAVTGSAQPLDINLNGYVILTVVTKDDSGVAIITDQQAVGGMHTASHVGTGTGNAATLPNADLPAVHQTLVAAEVFYRFLPITPVGKLLGIGTPTQLYDAAYF
jgi:Flp pilus assembly protein TadG